jgi:hypothetical protein
MNIYTLLLLSLAERKFNPLLLLLLCNPGGATLFGPTPVGATPYGGMPPGTTLPPTPIPAAPAPTPVPVQTWYAPGTCGTGSPDWLCWLLLLFGTHFFGEVGEGRSTKFRAFAWKRAKSQDRPDGPGGAGLAHQR